MPAFCAFFSMTPSEYRALSVIDFKAMAAFMRRTLDARR